jgi:predicted nucleic acid-binding Zn ribbon protein
VKFRPEDGPPTPGAEDTNRHDGAATGPSDTADTPAGDAPRLLLNRLRDASAARGDFRAPAARRRRSGSNAGRPSFQESYSGRDPQGVGAVFGRLLTERGWNSPVAVGSVMARWAELVGPEIATHCTPESFHETTVLVRCDSTAWATQLRLISPDLLRRFEHELGPGVVTAMKIIGPSAPSWRKGGRSVRGRGPRDTYG